ncbi:TPA: hypothetical protein HA251_00390 [Candidatus Woesearchaeota archaeon]|nr:hypothetical protein [Candidatus Woesearchaeota archaeon]
MVRHDLVAAAFLRLSMRAKIHQHLDTLDDRKERVMNRIEKDEISVYADDMEYSDLERMKQEALAIRFLE